MAAFNGVVGGITGGVGSAFSGAGVAAQVAVQGGMGASANITTQEVFTGHVDWRQVAFAAGMASVATGIGAKLSLVQEVNEGTASHPGPAATEVSEAPSGPHSPDFVVHPNGDVVPVPKGAVGPSPVANGKGFQFEGGSGGHSLDPRVADVRIMDPARSGKHLYTNGYVSYSNASGQAVNPYTGQAVPKSSPWWHWKF
jgi:hypothetical protein